MNYKFPNWKEFTSTNYKFNTRIAVLLEAANSVPIELVLGRFMKYLKPKSFNNYKNDLSNINESINSLEVNIPFPNYSTFTSGVYQSNLKLKYLLESFNYIPPEISLKTLIMNMDNVSFSNFEKNIKYLKESVFPIFEKKREGRGGLKQLVGKDANDELTSKDANIIGAKIAAMTGEKKKNFIGIVNYLGSTCIVYHEIKNSYLDEVKKEIKNEENGSQIKPFKPKRPEGNDDTLKFLVGKTGQERIEPSEGTQIGRLIAKMENVDRRDYVGMVNFLGASCRIHHEILDAYINAKNEDDNNQPKQKSEKPLSNAPKEIREFTNRMKNDEEYNEKTNERIRRSMKEKEQQK